MNPRVLVFVFVALLLIGCAKQEESSAPTSIDAVNPTQQAGGESVAPISPSVGGVSPVTGSDSVTGAGGGGVSQAAKEKAKEVAGSQSSTPPPPTDE